MNKWIKNINETCIIQGQMLIWWKKCHSNQKWNNSKCRYECKKHHICEKDYIWNPDPCSCKNGKCLASIIDNSVITCDDIIEETKTVPTKV